MHEIYTYKSKGHILEGREGGRRKRRTHQRLETPIFALSNKTQMETGQSLRENSPQASWELRLAPVGEKCLNIHDQVPIRTSVEGKRHPSPRREISVSPESVLSSRRGCPASSSLKVPVGEDSLGELFLCSLEAGARPAIERVHSL